MLLASDYDKSKYFNGTSLDREKKFRIKITTEEVLTDKKGKQEKKLVVWFTNDERGLPLNKTNLRALKNAFGDDTADWKNKIIAMYPVMASNDMQGLRVKIVAEVGCGSINTTSGTGWKRGSSSGSTHSQQHRRQRNRRPETVPRQQHHRQRRLLLIRSSSRIRPMSLTAEQDAELDDEIPEKW